MSLDNHCKGLLVVTKAEPGKFEDMMSLWLTSTATQRLPSSKQFIRKQAQSQLGPVRALAWPRNFEKVCHKKTRLSCRPRLVWAARSPPSIMQMADNVNQPINKKTQLFFSFSRSAEKSFGVSAIPKNFSPDCFRTRIWSFYDVFFSLERNHSSKHFLFFV